MIERIFLDLDDVCNSFTMASLEAVGCPVGPYDYHLYPASCGFDIVQAASLLLPLRRPRQVVTGDWFWRQLDRAHWTSVPKSEELPWLLELCETLVGRENVCILTATPRDYCKNANFIADAKVEWIRSFMPKWLHNQFLIGPTKHFCARPNSLLIDDSDENITQWLGRGGQAICMPRPWNRWNRSMSPTECHAYFMDILSFARRV